MILTFLLFYNSLSLEVYNINDLNYKNYKHYHRYCQCVNQSNFTSTGVPSSVTLLQTNINYNGSTSQIGYLNITFLFIVLSSILISLNW